VTIYTSENNPAVYRIATLAGLDGIILSCAVVFALTGVCLDRNRNRKL